MKTHLFRSSAGIDHYMLTDGQDTRFAAEQSTSAVLDNNKAMLNHNDGYSPTRELRRVASIPYIIGLTWLNDEGWWFMDSDNSDRLAAKLNDPEWSHLRTAPGRVGTTNGRMH